MDACRRRVPMRYRAQVMRRRTGRDLQRLRQATAPIDIGLQDIERAGIDEPLEAPARVLVLGPRERNADLVLDPPIAVDTVRHAAFLQPARPELRNARSKVDDVVRL